jgi:hypothetical protein
MKPYERLSSYLMKFSFVKKFHPTVLAFHLVLYILQVRAQEKKMTRKAEFEAPARTSEKK